MMLNYKNYKEADKVMENMFMPGEKYKGYFISYRVIEDLKRMVGVDGFTVIISISKAGKTLNVNRYINKADSESYIYLTNESKTLVDFIEYQIEAARNSTATETDDKIDFGSYDDIDIPQTTTEAKPEKIDELHSWLYQKEK